MLSWDGTNAYAKYQEYNVNQKKFDYNWENTTIFWQYNQSQIDYFVGKGEPIQTIIAADKNYTVVLHQFNYNENIYNNPFGSGDYPVTFWIDIETGGTIKMEFFTSGTHEHDEDLTKIGALDNPFGISGYPTEWIGGWAIMGLLGIIVIMKKSIRKNTKYIVNE